VKKILEFKSVTVTKSKKNILHNITFNLNKGDYVGLIGPNGAGKTTLLKTILGVQKPTSGQLIKPSNSSIGYVPQKNVHNLSSPISVQEVIATGLKHSHFFFTYKSKQKSKDVLERVGLTEEFLNKNFQKLSGGQQQRVLIARSLINQPELILFDEPFNGVDLPTQNKIYSLLEKLNQEGVTIIFVSHDITTITEKCNRVLCLDKTLHEGCHPVYSEFKSKCSHNHSQNISSNQHQLPIHHHNHS
jgi:zinc transport system ATP-binding protein